MWTEWSEEDFEDDPETLAAFRWEMALTLLAMDLTAAVGRPRLAPSLPTPVKGSGWGLPRLAADEVQALTDALRWRRLERDSDRRLVWAMTTYAGRI